MSSPSLPVENPFLSPARQMELEQLLKPISEDQPCGPAMRYAPVFTEIRLAREEDDPSLPMGQWERPLKRADWPSIAARCGAVLSNQSKDLQIAAWLLEAWTRQDGFPGLYRGLVLVRGLLKKYWLPLHPVIDDDGDCDTRVAPLEWLNESISGTLKVHVPLLSITGRKPPRLTFADWESMTAKELTEQVHPEDEKKKKKPGETGEPPLTRDEVVEYALKNLTRDLESKRETIRGCLICLDSLDTFIGEQLGNQAPNLSRLKGTLEAIARVLTQLLPEPTGQDMTDQSQSMDIDSQDLPAEGAQDSGQAAPARRAARTGSWASRDEAYATLGAIADYLSELEPHSPTPYLLRRAVSWGRMPLPELMAEIIREEGDLNRLAKVLGLQE